jgi:hypothetical protein
VGVTVGVLALTPKMSRTVMGDDNRARLCGITGLSRSVIYWIVGAISPLLRQAILLVTDLLREFSCVLMQPYRTTCTHSLTHSLTHSYLSPVLCAILGCEWH